jgi:hypothetical protein
MRNRWRESDIHRGVLVRREKEKDAQSIDVGRQEIRETKKKKKKREKEKEKETKKRRRKKKKK